MEMEALSFGLKFAIGVKNYDMVKLINITDITIQIFTKVLYKV